MKQSIIFLAFILHCSFLTAQILKGVVVDSSTKQPIDYVNIILKNKTDSSYVNGAISDQNGIFTIDSKDISNFFIEISRLGYQEYIIPNPSSSDTIRVELIPSTIGLGEVVVKSTRSISRITASGLQTTVANTILSEMGTGNDVLKRIPMVTGNGGVYEVFGRGQAKIYINNREVRDPSEIDNLNSKDISSVEVISNPGSRYDATVAAIILIKTTKKQGDGFSFNLRSSFQTWGNQDYINQLNTNYRKGGLDVFLNLYHTDITSTQKGDISQKVSVDTIWYQQNYIDLVGRQDILKGTVGANYEINDKHTIGFRYELEKSPIDGNVSIKLISDVYANDLLFDRWDNNEFQKIKIKPSSKANLYYAGKVEKLSIDFNTDFLYGATTKVGTNIENSEEFGERTIKSTSNVDNQLWAAKLQLSYPIWKGKLLIGSEYTNIARGDAYINDYLIDFSSKINVNEQNLALFTEYQVETKVGNFSAGLRYENANYDYLVDGEKEYDKSRMYRQWFPNFSYSNRIGEMGLQFNYNSKAVRPSYRQLSNNLNYANKLTLETGNPYLQPTILHNISLTGTWKILQAQISYSDQKDAIVMWIDRYEKDPKISVLTFRNIDKLPRVSAFVAVAPVFGVWKPRLNVGIQKYWQDYAAYGIDIYMKKPIFFANLNNIFTLPKDWIISLDGSYTSKGNLPAVYLYEDKLRIDAGVSKGFLKKSLQVQLSISDIFHQNKNPNMIITPQTEFRNYYKFDSRYVSITVRYNFNPARSKYKGSSAGQDAMNRL